MHSVSIVFSTYKSDWVAFMTLNYVLYIFILIQSMFIKLRSHRNCAHWKTLHVRNHRTLSWSLQVAQVSFNRCFFFTISSKLFTCISLHHQKSQYISLLSWPIMKYEEKPTVWRKKMSFGATMQMMWFVNGIYIIFGTIATRYHIFLGYNYI